MKKLGGPERRKWKSGLKKILSKKVFSAGINIKTRGFPIGFQSPFSFYTPYSLYCLFYYRRVATRVKWTDTEFTRQRIRVSGADPEFNFEGGKIIHIYFYKCS